MSSARAAAGAARVVACLPAWQAGEFIDATLRSLASQTHDNLEVLISVDLSSDDTAERCARFATTHPNCTLMRQTERLGWIGNVNALLRAARGDYCFFALHDDLLEPSYVSRLAARLDERPEAVLAYSDMTVHYPEGRVEEFSYTALDGASTRLERARRIIRRQDDWWIPYRGLFRRSAADRIGGMKRNLAGEFAADWPWLLHLSMLGELARVPELLCHKHFKWQSLSRTWRYSDRRWLAVSLACARAVACSDLRAREKLALLRALVGRTCQAALNRPKRRLRFGSPG